MEAESNERRSQPSNEHRITRTRNRVPLSCVACRIRKLKCNREKPCQNCIVRGDAVATACSYASAANPRALGSKGAKPNAIDMRGRIDRLETLVRSLISEEASLDVLDEPGPNSGLVETSSEKDHFALQGLPLGDKERPEEVRGSPSRQKMALDTRSTHWDAILHDITAIKDAWGEAAEDPVDETSLQHSPGIYRPGLLNGLSRPPGIQTLVASLPPKASADKLMSRFFEMYNPAVPAQFLIHRPTFSKQYDQHWKHPTKTKPIWLGLLYTVLCFAMQSYEDTDEELPEFQGTSKLTSELYRTHAAQCILAADITKPTSHMIEAILLYSMVEYHDKNDGDMTVWMISGLAIRLALKQGYHRDPSQYPDMSPFQAERRRRLWMIVNQHELIYAVQLGLPKMIRYAECDTTTPRNLYEEELYEDMKELPPSRPETEPTPISYQITKSRILRAYGYVIEHLHVVEEQSYETVMRLDAGLLESRSLIPFRLRLQAQDEMRQELPGFIVEKYILENFYHKAICVLHRKYLNSSLFNDAYEYSRRTCIASALELLRQQVSMHSACQPGGPLERIKWYRFSLFKHDFLLAAMVLCLAIYNDKTQYGAAETDHVGEFKLDQRIEMFDALQHGKRIWAEVAHDSADSERALSILTTVLEKLGMKDPRMETNRANHSIQGPNPNSFDQKPKAVNSTSMLPVNSNMVESVLEKPMDNSWAPTIFTNTLGNLNNMTSPPEQSYYNNDAIYDNLFASGGIFNSFEPELNIPANLDWAAWDFYIKNGNRMYFSQDDTWSSDPSFQFSLNATSYQ